MAAIRKGTWGNYRVWWLLGSRAVGYLSLLVPPILRLFGEGDDLQLPQYYDYQLKGKYFLIRKALRLGAAIGSFDTFDISTDEQTAEEKESTKVVYPRNTGSLTFDNIFTKQPGFYYTYKPSSKYRSKLILFNSTNYSRFYINSDSFVADSNPTDEVGTETIDVNVKPNVAGIKNKVEWSYWDPIATLRLDELNHYYFNSNGTTQTITQPLLYTGQPEPVPPANNNKLFWRQPDSWCLSKQ